MHPALKTPQMCKKIHMKSTPIMQIFLFLIKIFVFFIMNYTLHINFAKTLALILFCRCV